MMPSGPTMEQQMIGTYMCPDPHHTTDQELTARINKCNLRSTVAAVIFGAALTTGFIGPDKPLSRVFSGVVAILAVSAWSQNDLRRRANQIVLENRAYLGQNSIYKYKPPVAS